MNPNREVSCTRWRIVLGAMVVVSLGLAARFALQDPEHASEPGAIRPPATLATDNAPPKQDEEDISDGEQGAAPSRLTLEKFEVSQRIAAARQLLRIIEASDARRVHDFADEARHVIAVRIETPTVGQHQPLYDLLSSFSRDFPAGSDAGNAFHDQAGRLLNEIGRYAFRVVIKSSEFATGSTDIKWIEATQQSVEVKCEGGVVRVVGPHRTGTAMKYTEEFDHLFPKK